MKYRSERERAGYTRILFRDAMESTVKRNEFEPLMEAIRRGDEWYEAEDLYGDPEWIRLSAVVRVSEATPASIAAYDVEYQEREQHEKTHGDGA